MVSQGEKFCYISFSRLLGTQNDIDKLDDTTQEEDR